MGRAATGQQLGYTRPASLPSFEAPPVTEVSLGVQLRGLRPRAVDLGILHGYFRALYPIVEEHPPTPLQIEQLGPGGVAGIQFEFLNRPPLPMLVFLSNDRRSLIQVQEDRFAYAWRRTDVAAVYPRYESFRQEFLKNFERLSDFCQERGLNIQPSQAEISYLNDIPFTEGERPDVLAALVPRPEEPAGSNLTSRAFSLTTTHRFTYKNTEGVEYARLHIVSEPNRFESESSLKLQLTFRGEPLSESDDEPIENAIMRFFDEGHDRIVQAFAVNTTPEAQSAWRRDK